MSGLFPERFTHLHVAPLLSDGGLSGGELSGGAANAFVHRAVRDGATASALTERDGLGAAIRHVRACLAAGIDSILGIDLAVGSDGDQSPRVVVLGHGSNHGAGWAALCRLSTANDAARSAGSGSRAPFSPQMLSADELARCLRPAPSAITVLLGPDSDVGRAVARADRSHASGLLETWRALLPGVDIALEVVCHFSETDDRASVRHAVRMLKLAHAHGVPAVIGNAVRYLNPRGEDQTNSADQPKELLDPFIRSRPGHAWPKPARQMHRIASLLVEHSRLPPRTVDDVLAHTERVADRCRLDPVADLHWGTSRLPENEILGLAAGPDHALRERVNAAVLERYSGASQSERERLHRRLEQELESVERDDLSRQLLVVAEIGRVARHAGIRFRLRGPATEGLLGHLLGLSMVAPQRWPVDTSSERPAAMPSTAAPPAIAVASGSSRAQYPVEIEVERHRLSDLHRAVYERFGSERFALLPDDSGIVLGDRRLSLSLPLRATETALPISALDGADMTDLGVLAIAVAPDPAQSALAYALAEIARVHSDTAAVAGGLPAEAAYVLPGGMIDLDRIPLDDEATFETIRTAHTLGMIGLERREQRDLIVAVRPAVLAELARVLGPHHSDLAESCYQSAWLKTHYPVEFLAGALANAPDGLRREALLSEARRMRVPALPLDVNCSSREYRVERVAPPRAHGVVPDPDDVHLGIRLPLGVVHGLTSEDIGRIGEARPFATLHDFVQRAGLTLEQTMSLAHSGALNALIGDGRGQGRAVALVRELLAADHRRIAAQRSLTRRKRTNTPEAVSLFTLHPTDDLLSPSPGR